ncbi:LexA family protein [Methylorubrum zatmanii]
MTRLGLTPKQRELLTFIEQRLETSSVSPSFDEMRKHLGLGSKSGVFRLVEALEERGHIVRKPNRPHSIALRRDDPPTAAPERPDPAPTLQRLEQGLKIRLSPNLSRRLLTFCSERGADPAREITAALSAHIAGGRA